MLETAPTIAEGPAESPPALVEATPLVPPAPPTPDKTLPPRVDLAYKVFLGTQGFLIGEATYRFEHEGNRYHIATVAQARGLAALFIRGHGKVESRGLITPDGLVPQEFTVERGSSDRREVRALRLGRQHRHAARRERRAARCRRRSIR